MKKNLAISLSTSLGTAEISTYQYSPPSVRLQFTHPEDESMACYFSGHIWLPGDPFEGDATVRVAGRALDRYGRFITGRAGKAATVVARQAIAAALGKRQALISKWIQARLDRGAEQSAENLKLTQANAARSKRQAARWRTGAAELAVEPQR